MEPLDLVCKCSWKLESVCVELIRVIVYGLKGSKVRTFLLLLLLLLLMKLEEAVEFDDFGEPVGGEEDLRLLNFSVIEFIEAWTRCCLTIKPIILLL